MKLGISIRINVTKIDKDRLFNGEKGTYLDLTTFVDTDETDKYDNNGFISQSLTKDEREKGIQTEILGNCKVFYKGGGGSSQPQQSTKASQEFDDEIPF